METQEISMPPHHQAIMNRFAAACQADERIVAALARGQLWSAYGALEDLRRTCINLARLQQDSSMAAEGYEKVEQVLPIEQLSPLQPTFCPMERDAMLRAALIIVRFYQNLVSPLAQAHGIAYPTELAKAMSERLERLCQDLEVDMSELIESTSD